MWALPVILILYVVCFAVNILPHSSAMRAITWLLFALFHSHRLVASWLVARWFLGGELVDGEVVASWLVVKLPGGDMTGNP